MKSTEKFHSLIGSKVSREAIGEIIELAKSENNTSVVYRLFKALNDNPFDSFFEITDLTVYPAIPTGLNGVQHSGSYKEALDNCGRLNPGYKFQGGVVVKVPEVRKKQSVPKIIKPKVVVKKETTVKPTVAKRKHISKESFYKTIVASDAKEFYTKIQFLDEYLTIEKNLDKVHDKLLYLRDTEDTKAIDLHEKEVEKLNKSLSLQIVQGAKFYKIDPLEFIALLEDYTEDKTAIKKRILPVEKVKVSKKVNRPEPKSYDIKPKSVSVATAVKDVLSLEKYTKIKPMQANLLYKIFKDDIDLEYAPTEFEAGVLRSIPRSIAYASDWTVSLENDGQKFIQAINGRIASLRNQKNNYALFDGLKGTGEEPKTTIVETISDPVQPKATMIKDTDDVKNLKSLGFVSAADVPEEPKDVFVLPGAIGAFMQKIQPHKALILIKGTKHTSKSQLAMQIANAFGEMGTTVAYIDYEQGGMESKDTVDSINRNTTEAGRKNILIKGHLEKPFEELKKFCQYCGVIAADSVTDLGITADQLNELRCGYPKVIWVFISQVKENGEMYGGNKMAHNPTCIIECHPSHDPKLRYATLNKNRGNNLELMYWIMDKKLREPETTEATIIETVAEVKPITTSKFSFQT